MERFVDEEVKRVLFGVKQMKEFVERNEEKHEHLMKSLRHSSEKKQGALQLAEEVKQKLEQAEDQCQASLKASWDECRSCLEDTCKSFYISTCRRGFSTFSSKLNEISHLINVSSQQYEEVLQIVQHHTEDTVSWIKHMTQRFGWVTELANTTVEHESVFSITKVLPHSGEGTLMPVSATAVEVNVFNSPTFTLNVPGELQIEDPAFIKYVAQEALGLYKEMSK
ncbi:UNVERIFIED_CONTAM: hypothetical protein FKN15_067592 [Acipenser sinensis]